MMLNAPMNSAAFLAYVEQVLAQARRCRLMDNLPAHNSAPISDALTRFSAEECANYFAAAGYAPT
jgi:hypothetical protein